MEAEQERKDRLESERKKRFELETILLKWLGVSNVLEIPEVKIDAQKERGERIFSIKPSRRFNEIPNRLIAEVAIYYKFIKNKRRGYVFTYAGDIEPFFPHSAPLSCGFLEYSVSLDDGERAKI